MVKSTRPPSLTTLVRRTLFGECGVGRGDSLLVAVSGGGDSMALLHALSLFAGRWRLRIVGCGVDHGLRPEARAELDLAEALCRGAGFEFERIVLSVAPGANLQARARAARYGALAEVKGRRGLRWLATAHHADDRAETVILRILRGAPPAGLAVLPPRSNDLLRPMIRASKRDVLAHLARHRLAFAEDPSNQDARFVRVRVRTQLMPLLTELSPNVVGHLCSLADELAEPALPAIWDDGEQLRLGQAQRRALQRALRDRSRRARVLLRGGRSLRLSPEGGPESALELVESMANTPCKPRKKSNGD